MPIFQIGILYSRNIKAKKKERRYHNEITEKKKEKTTCQTKQVGANKSFSSFPLPLSYPSKHPLFGIYHQQWQKFLQR